MKAKILLLSLLLAFLNPIVAMRLSVLMMGGKGTLFSDSNPSDLQVVLALLGPFLIAYLVNALVLWKLKSGLLLKGVLSYLLASLLVFSLVSLKLIP